MSAPYLPIALLIICFVLFSACILINNSRQTIKKYLRSQVELNQILANDHHKIQKNLYFRIDFLQERISNFPDGILKECTDVIDFGAQKYEKDGWKQKANGHDYYFRKAVHHMEHFKFRKEELDKESGKHHFAHAIVNLIFALWHNNQIEKESPRPAVADGEDR